MTYLNRFVRRACSSNDGNVTQKSKRQPLMAFSFPKRIFLSIMYKIIQSTDLFPIAFRLPMDVGNPAHNDSGCHTERRREEKKKIERARIQSPHVTRFRDAKKESSKNLHPREGAGNWRRKWIFPMLCLHSFSVSHQQGVHSLDAPVPTKENGEKP